MSNWKMKRRRELIQLLGELPAADTPARAVSSRIEERDSYIIEKLILDLNGLEPVPAYFVRPKQTSGKLPVILFNHSHGGNYHIGKEELLKGTSYLETPAYADFVTRHDFAALCIDAWGFGERSTRTESAIFKQMLWNGQVMWGMMIHDSMRAVDYLLTRPDVNGDRIGTLGISMGGTMAWWLAAVDERIRYCVDLCSLADYDALIETEALDYHGIYYYVPSIRKHFTTGEINALISPRPHLSFTGLQDKLVPSIGLDKTDMEIQKAYAADGASDAWKLLRYQVGHEETAEMRAEIGKFLLKHR